MKFKVGDKVRIIDGPYAGSFICCEGLIGEIGTVKIEAGSLPYNPDHLQVETNHPIENRKVRWWYTNEQVELYVELTPQTLEAEYSIS